MQASMPVPGRQVPRRRNGAQSRALAAALRLEIEAAGFGMADVARSTPHAEGGTYGDTNARYGFVTQVLSEARTSGLMVERLRAAFEAMKAEAGAER